jgi:8-amino-7-oxononanoate synthase
MLSSIMLDRWDFQGYIRELGRQGLYRRIIDREGPQGRIIKIKGVEVINFSSNDYLGLCNNRALIDRAIRTIRTHGVGAGASRLLSGGTELHRELENIISEFKGTEKTILFNSGYSANTGAIATLCDKDTVIFSDELNHASIIDGCRLSRGDVIVYRHADTGHLKELIKNNLDKKRIIITDSVFSMDGDIAPIKEIVKLAKEFDCLIYLDEAHSTGVLGEGKGILHHYNIKPEPFIVQMGTLSKALGSVGAFVTGKEEIIEFLINKARSLIYSTALPAHDIAVSLEAIRIIQRDKERIKRLWQNREHLVSGLKELGLDTASSETPIIPVIVPDNERAIRLSDFLLKKGFYAPPVRMPTVKIPRIRLTVTAVHEDEDIRGLISALKGAKDCGLL